MKNIIVTSIATIGCGLLTAQPSNSFSTQIKALLKEAANGFKTISPNYKLEGALDGQMEYGYDSTRFYHATFANKLPRQNADRLIKQLTGKIKLALGEKYTYLEKSPVNGFKEIHFVNKSKTNFEVVVLHTYCVTSKCNVYINIFHDKQKKFEKINHLADIAARVKKIIVYHLGVSEAEVVPEASFTNDLGADSLDTVELIMAFEQEFNISIDDKEAEKILTVGQAIDYVLQRAG